MKANMKKKPAVDSIRVNTGAKRIEVNDDGEYITLNFGDQTFPTRYFAMLDDFQAREPEFTKQAQEIDKREYPSDIDKSRAIAAFNLEMHEYFRDKIDGLFGAETCRKVFGDIVPGIELYSDFLEQLAPFFDAYGKERSKKISSKYNAARKGNV